VAGHLDDGPAPFFDGGTGQRVVPRERRLHACRFTLPQLSAPLDVGEEEGRDRGVIVHAWDLGQTRADGYFTARRRAPPAALCAWIVVHEHGFTRRDATAFEQDAKNARIRLDHAFLTRHDDAVEPRQEFEARVRVRLPNASMRCALS